MSGDLAQGFKTSRTFWKGVEGGGDDTKAIGEEDPLGTAPQDTAPLSPLR